MFFRNLIFFRFPHEFGGLFPSPVADAFDGLETVLAEVPLKPVGPMEMHSRGFISPYGRFAEGLVHRVGSAACLTLGGEDKILPAAVVNAELAKRIQEREKRGETFLGRARKQLKDQIQQELLPKAFVKLTSTGAYFDFTRNLLVIDTSSRNVAEQVVTCIRTATGSFPALPVNAQRSVRIILTAWLAGEEMPEGLALGEECALEQSGSDGARVSVRNLDLHGEEITKHLEAGLQCTRLALVLDDRISFVLGEDLTVRKLRFLDIITDEIELNEGVAHAELSAQFALQAGEVGRLFDLLHGAFYFSEIEEDSAPKPAPRPRTKRKPFEGVESVTISSGGDELITMSGEAFAEWPKKIGRMAEIIAWVRDNDNTTISGMQRFLKCGYNEAARVVEALEAVGVVSPPGPDGKRVVLPLRDTA